MLAERRHDVDDLNHRARQWRSRRRRAARTPKLDIGGRAFQAGDRVLCLRNDRRLDVHNGTLATITGRRRRAASGHDPHRRRGPSTSSRRGISMPGTSPTATP